MRPKVTARSIYTAVDRLNQLLNRAQNGNIVVDLRLQRPGWSRAHPKITGISVESIRQVFEVEREE